MECDEKVGDEIPQAMGAESGGWGERMEWRMRVGELK